MTLKRSSRNPILTRGDIPDLAPILTDATSVFNPAAVKFDDKYLLMLRVQSRGRETYLLMAESEDGVEFTVGTEFIRFCGIEDCSEDICHIYDPRISEIDGIAYVMFAADMDVGCRLGVGLTRDFKHFEFVGFGASEDTRNGVLFPERIDGHYVRLDRPNRVALEGGPTSGDEIFLSRSDDLVNWVQVASVAQGRQHYWDERIGSGPPPIKTKEGWLHVYHGVATHFGSNNIYQAGVMLLDLAEPHKVLARGRNNVLEPRESYEMIGQVPNVVFPSGMIVEDEDSQGFADLSSNVYVYYGAADTVVGLATATVRDLIAACYE
jgi:predicted GH43/DUF377 family glycosyl hydrolase